MWNGMENEKMYYYYNKEKARENDVTSGHLPANDVISSDAASGYILKTNNLFLFVLGTSML